MEINFVNWIKGKKQKIDNKESQDIDPYKEENWDEKLPCEEHKWGKVQVEHLIAKEIYYVQCEVCGIKRRVHAGYLD